MKWGKSKPRPPKEWLTAYPEAEFAVVSRENYLQFILD
jgi:hypothetical protein